MSTFASTFYSSTIIKSKYILKNGQVFKTLARIDFQFRMEESEGEVDLLTSSRGLFTPTY